MVVIVCSECGGLGYVLTTDGRRDCPGCGGTGESDPTGPLLPVEDES